MASSFAGATPPDLGQSGDSVESLLAALQLALKDEDHDRLVTVERQLKSIQFQHQSQNDAAQIEVRELRLEIERLRQAARDSENLTRDLQMQLGILQHKSQADADGLMARVTPVMGEMIRRTVHDSRDEMAEALGPVMGEAIRVQIRNSREDMIEALYPVIGSTVQRAIVEFGRELQRNIDARLKAVVGPRGMLRSLWARLRGVSTAQLILRDSIPFTVQDVFVIQHQSGLLIAHRHAGDSSTVDSGLISGMLTAIRSFAHDSFGAGLADQELNTIQYGNQSILLQSDQAAYLAVVITGIEPAGFHAQMRDFLSELHVRHGQALRAYEGDLNTAPDLQADLARFMASTATPIESIDLPRPMRRETRLIAIGCGTLGLLATAVACFYLQFTIVLWPIAYPGPTATPTVTLTATPSPEPTQAAPLPIAPPATSTPTPEPSATSEPVPTVTPSQTSTPGPTATPVTAFAAGHVWARPAPDENAPLQIVLLQDTPVTVLAAYGDWLEVEWLTSFGWQRGWVPSRWITLREPIAPERITPTATP